ncbi:MULTISPECIES: hypothetical protein [unclassified Streptomyces]|uniref:hypothetical protein n=1 Tax=unclassified Streptomyces TaxID=2593676 RepID=UPI001CBFDFFD|nr:MULTISPECIES: hypothetical protein [unclassified Streptomyces]WPO72399.1 hypothetical protein R9806_18055 [Streptomyces sp. KN37]
MAVFDDDLPGTTRWPVGPDAGLDYCQWCAQLRQADGLAELSAHVEAARRNDSVPMRGVWGGLWRGRGRFVLLSAATAAVLSGFLAVALV